MASYRTVEPQALEVFTARVFEALGTPEDIAAEVAAHLVHANLAGHDSHGVIRIPQYATMIAQGTLRPAGRPSMIRERGATFLIDAGDGFGQFATTFALEQAIERAAELGVAVATIRRANHIGRVGHYTERAARRGYVAEVTVGAAGPGIGGAAPFGGAARFLGTNPWSLAVPTGGEPVLVDFATTVVAEGKVRVARSKHEALPPGCIVDQRGRPSTDPEDFYAGGMLLPFGGHKGYGLALAAALFGGLAAIGESDPSMAGAAAPPAEKGAGDRTGGVFMLVVDPGAFGDAALYAAAAGRVVDAVKRVPPAPGVPE
ncbi:MAG: Ldh family oxidoreductase, partial [Chloroflexota bacterium]